MSEGPAGRTQLVLVSNRGPVTFHADGEAQRGSGGLVTALTGLATHRDVIWIATGVFINVINIFLTLLRIFGGR